MSLSWFHWNGPIYSSIIDDDDNTTFRGNSGAYREMCNEREGIEDKAVVWFLRDRQMSNEWFWEMLIVF